MNHAIRNYITILLAAISLVACSSMTVNNDWDTRVDFTQFQTFTLLDDSEAINRLIDQRIRNALVNELTSRGLRETNKKEKADLAIGYTVTTEQRRSYQTVHSGWGMSHHGHRSSSMHWGTSMGTSRTVQHDFTVGTLVIAMYQVKNKELVWEGTASDTVNPGNSPQESEQRINEAVQKILKNFPPPIKADK